MSTTTMPSESARVCNECGTEFFSTHSNCCVKCLLRNSLTKKDEENSQRSRMKECAQIKSLKKGAKPAQEQLHGTTAKEEANKTKHRRMKESAPAQSLNKGTKPVQEQLHGTPDKAEAKKTKPYLDDDGNASCPLCQKSIPYSQLDTHIENTHGSGLLGYYKPWSRQGRVRATFVSAGAPGLSKHRK